MSALPTPPRRPSSEADLDAVLDKIDECLPKVHQRAAKADTPTSGLRPENFKKTQAAFAAMSEELLESNSDLKIDPAELERARARARSSTRYAARRTGS